MRARRTAAMVVALGALWWDAPACAATGQDVRSCYRFSDSLPPLAADAPAFSFIDVAQSGGTRLALDDEEEHLQPLQLEFPFQFYGRSPEAVYVSPNGFVTFSKGDSGSCGQRLPDGAPPNALVTGLWKHPDPGSSPPGGAVYYQTLGAAPHRQIEIEV